MSGERTLVVLMAVYNGEAYLAEQLDSIFGQSLKPTMIIFSDDGSCDGSVTLIKQRMATQPDIACKIIDGPRNGFADNFRHLIQHAPEEAAFFAFCDQDDIWMADKLEVAVAQIESQNSDAPCVYGGRTEAIAEDGATLGLSPHFKKPPSFKNALVQSIAGGNTMVMNAGAMRALKQSVRRHHFISHDWWTYLVITGAGGQLIYDPKPKIKYRQHGGNQIGANTSWAARLQRAKMLINGQWIGWNRSNMEGLEACQHLLTPEAAQSYALFKQMRNGSFFKRLRALIKGGFHRHTLFGKLSLIVMVVFKRI